MECRRPCGLRTAARNAAPCRLARGRIVCTVTCSQQLARQEDHAAHSRTVKLSFQIPYRTDFGQDIAMVGSTDLLGNWDPKRGVGMKWSEGDIWHVDFEVSPGLHLDMEYKYVVRNADGNASHWKPGSNYSFSLSSVAPLVLSKAAGRAAGSGGGGGAAAAPGAAQLGGVAVRDAWDGAERDVQVEVVEARGGMSEAERREQDAYRESLGAALAELSQQITQAEELSVTFDDPTAPHLLAADRAIAAATRKAVAFAQALNASLTRSRLPDQA